MPILPSKFSLSAALATSLLVAGLCDTAQGQIAGARRSGDLGGGFIEFLYNGGQTGGRAPGGPIPSARRMGDPGPGVVPASYGTVRVAPGVEPVRTLAARPAYDPADEPRRVAAPARPSIDPRYLPQQVDYRSGHRPGTVIIDTRQRYLYLVETGGTARRYGVGIGRPGFGWTGTKTVTRKAEWPDWRPPADMLRRRPDLPRFMAGGPANPLGARALYLGSSLYRIHGSNEPWTIGQAVSSGCFRMRNEDVIDLYNRVRVGTRVVVM